LPVGLAEEPGFLENDGPGKQRKEQQDQQDNSRDPARLLGDRAELARQEKQR
jgi:hypothetical protein